MCDVLSGGVPGCVTKCDRGRGGSKLAKNSVTYFMDGPLINRLQAIHNALASAITKTPSTTYRITPVLKIKNITINQILLSEHKIISLT